MKRPIQSMNLIHVIIYFNFMRKDILIIFTLTACVLSQAVYRKVVIPDGNALCLDGSRAAYYIHDGGATPNKFIVFFQGGGWCGGSDLDSSIEDCYQRSKTPMGSSNSYPATQSFAVGLLGNNAKNSFAGYTKIWVKYCDGSGHQGRRQAPIPYKGVNLFFRGNDITVAILNHVEQTHGLFSKGMEIMVSGGSAGGLASMMWSNYINERSAHKNVYNVPDAAVFLDVVNYKTGQQELSKLFMNLFRLSNTEINPPVPECVAAFPGQTFRCMLTQNLLRYVKVPIFHVQSLYDIVGMSFLVGTSCYQGRSLNNCNAEERAHIEDYHSRMNRYFAECGGNPPNGFWAGACVGHEFLNAEFYSADYAIPMRTDNTIHNTLRAWVDKRAVGHKYIDSGQWPSNQPCS